MNAMRNGMQSRATSQVVKPATQRAWWRDDFLTSTQSQFLASGGGVGGLLAVAGHVGVARQTVTAAGVDGHQIQASTSRTENILASGGGILHFEVLVRVPTISDGVNNLVARIGLCDAASGLADAVDGIYFEYDFGTYGDHAWRIATSNNSVRTKNTTGFSPVANAWQHLSWDLNAVASSVSASFNGTFVGAVATNIPSARGTILTLQCMKSLGAGALMVDYDYYEIYQDLVPVR